MAVNAERVQAQMPLYVDPGNPRSSDSNPGSQTLPVKTIGKATALALAYNKNSVATKILIAPEVYHESINIVPSQGATAASITLEAMSTGKAVISGSDTWTDWVQVGNSNVYSHAWPYKWGEAAEPSSWQSLRTLPPALRRREIIFVNGAALDLVVSYSALRPSSFYVAESEGKVYIRPPASTNMSTAQIEVSTRAKLLLINGGQNITIRGLVFQHASTPVQGSAVEVANSSVVVLEDNQFIWNNWGGLGIMASQNVTIRRNVISANGLAGLQIWKVKNLLAEDNRTSYNNWRGDRNGFFGWATAGVKSLLVHGGVFRRHRSLKNSSHGLWFDTDCTNIEITDSFMNDNYTTGLFLESVQGPVKIKNAAICRNKITAGVLVANSRNVTLENSTIYGNGAANGKLAAQLFISGEYAGPREMRDWETGQVLSLLTENWTLRGNTIVGLNPNQMVLRTIVSPTVFNAFVRSLITGGNVWFNATASAAFLLPNATFMNFSTWQQTTGRDQTSHFAAPATVDCDP